MKHIFHLITIYFIYREMKWLFRTRDMLDLVDKRRSWLDKDDHVHELIDVPWYVLDVIWLLPISVWMAFGLFSFNGIIFCAIAVVAAIEQKIDKSLYKYSPYRIKIKLITATLGGLTGLYILLNSYVFQIELREIIHNWIWD